MKNYTPLFVNGEYVDNMELYERGKQGETHMCECRQKHDAFFNRSGFMTHIKLKCHQSWLASLDLPLPLPVETYNPITLKEEQDSEYEKALKQDQKKHQDKQDEEMRLMIQASEEAYQNELSERQLKEKRDIVNKIDVGYTIRFIFPNGNRNACYVPQEQDVRFMRNYVDVYMADKKIDIPTYEFFVYPNKTLDESHIIKDILDNRSSVYIRSLEN